MGFSDYFGRFWFAAEPVFGVVMTLCFLAILRNQALYAYPALLERAAALVVVAAISCCIAWGIVDGFFYVFENHDLTARKNLIANYAKSRKQTDESLKMVEEDLQDTHVNVLNEDEKKKLYETIVANYSKTQSKEKVPAKKSIVTIILDMCLNLGACLVIIFPLILLRNALAIPQLLDLAVVIAIVLMFIIGFWTEIRKSLLVKARKGIIYSLLGIFITILTYVLGG
jgi:hypothetical protein